MAHAEKRGKHWRVRYKGPNGTWPSASHDDAGNPFLTRRAAEDWGNDKEAEIRKNAAGWIDPHAGEITLAEFIEEQWWPSQDLAPRTEDRYRYHIKCQILPEYGTRPLSKFTSYTEVPKWEKRLHSQDGLSLRTARDARALLSTILGDARAWGLPVLNIAARKRGRGRISQRRRRRSHRSIEKKWATPLEVVLIAERTALLTGQDEDFVKVVTDGWTGMRWGESVGLEQPYIDSAGLHIDCQLSELNGVFEKVPPKDESDRLADLPPFLDNLLARLIELRPPRRCTCPGNRCGGEGRYLFLGPNGGHYRRSNFNRRVWRPAVDGRYPEVTGKRLRRARPVLVDMAASWPGVPLRPAWPSAVPGEEWRPPRGSGQTRHDGRDVTSWLAIKPGLTPHGLRHGHKTWMIEDGIPEILQHDRLGQILQGIGALYSHVSPLMRTMLKEALQRRWETALDQRIALFPHSPVAILEEVLAARREQQLKMISQTSPTAGR